MPLIWHPNDGFVWTIVEKFRDVPGYGRARRDRDLAVRDRFVRWAGALRERSSGDSPSQVFIQESACPWRSSPALCRPCSTSPCLAGEPLEKAAVANGASELLKMNAIYPFSNGGAFVTNAIWCLFLIVRNRTGGQLLRLPEKGTGRWPSTT